MAYKISKQLAAAEPMIMDDIAAKAAAIDGCISLSIGSPAPDTFPKEKMTKYYVEAMTENADQILSYDFENLATEEVTKWLESRGFDMSDKKLFFTPGSGPGMDVMCHTFCDKDDVILVEEFTYPGLLGAARVVEAKVVPVKSGMDGLDLADLEAKAKQYNPKFLYIVPTFSNPCGVTQSNEIRKGIVELAQKYDFMIYEDDPYAKLRFKGEAQEPMINMDNTGRVFHAETFSKILSAGIRVGYVVYPAELEMEVYLACGNMGGCSGPTLEMVSRFMKNESIEDQCLTAAKYYQNRLEQALAALEKHMPEGCQWTKPEGGMFIWLEVPETIDVEKFAFDLLDSRHVGIVPSSGFSPDPENKGHGFRLCFSVVPEEQIEPAVQAIAEELKKLL